MRVMILKSMVLWGVFASSPEIFCEYLFFIFALGFGIEKWREFLVNFLCSLFVGKQSMKNPQKIWEN